MQVQSLLLETQHSNTWKEHGETAGLLKTEAKQRHTWRERLWAPPSEEHNNNRAVKSFIHRPVLLGLCLPSCQISGFFLHI